MFVLFQYGMPITYVLSPSHYNYYFNLFTEDVQINALIYTIFAIQIFCISLTIGIFSKFKDNRIIESGKWRHTILNNSQKVSQLALILFIFTSVFVIPINTRAAFSAIAAHRVGINIGNMYRGAMSETSILRFMQQFYFPSGILFLCFSSKIKIKKVVTILYLMVAVMLLVVADRSAGITALIVFVLYKFYSSKNNNKFKKSILIIIAVAFLGVFSIYIAENRSTGTGFLSVLSGNIFIQILDEMGFNFTSICFVMSYIPKYDSFRYGLSYLAAIALLVPKSFDFFGLYQKIQSVLGETWLWNINNKIGRSNLSFGVGFSIIAESYYNFAWFGLILMIPFGIIIAFFLRERDKCDNPWKLYIRLALLLGFFTLPRRQFSSMLKSLEYSVFFMMVYLIVFIRVTRKTEKN